jgi:hypothetical protein
MDTNTFWEIIEKSRKKTKGKLDKQHKKLVKTLKKLNDEELLEYENHFRAHMRRLSSMDWMVAHFIVWNYTAPEAFDDFRAWIISLGREAYEKTASNPQHIATILKPTEVRATLAADAILEAAEDAWMEKFGENMPAGKLNDRDVGFEEQWPESREGFQEKFPELFAAFWDDRRIGQLHPELAASARIKTDPLNL